MKLLRSPTPSPLQHLSLSQKLGEALPRPRYFHHRAVVLLDLHQPLLPLAGSRRRRHRCTVRVLNVEVPSVRHSVIGDLDHGEYDSVIHVHWNASARDLQGYVDALSFLLIVGLSIDRSWCYVGKFLNFCYVPQHYVGEMMIPCQLSTFSEFI